MQCNIIKDSYQLNNRIFQVLICIEQSVSQCFWEYLNIPKDQHFLILIENLIHA